MRERGSRVYFNSEGIVGYYVNIDSNPYLQNLNFVKETSVDGTDVVWRKTTKITKLYKLFACLFEIKKYENIEYFVKLKTDDIRCTYLEYFFSKSVKSYAENA